MSSRSLVVAIETVTNEGLKSNPVVLWTLRNHARKGDKLIFIHGTKHLDAATAKAAGYVGDASAEQTNAMEKKATSTILEMLSAYGPDLSGLHVQVKITKGDPRDVLMKSIEGFSPDAVIIGSRGAGVVKRTLLGSVSDYLSKNSPVTVIIVKAQ